MTPATKTRTITVERTIRASQEEVFAWLSTGTNYTASPLVFTAKLVRAGKDAPWGLGARRQFATAVAWFDEEIVAYDAPSSFEYRIVASVPPIDHELGLIQLHEVQTGPASSGPQRSGSGSRWSGKRSAPWPFPSSRVRSREYSGPPSAPSPHDDDLPAIDTASLPTHLEGVQKQARYPEGLPAPRR